MRVRALAIASSAACCLHFLMQGTQSRPASADPTSDATVTELKKELAQAHARISSLNAKIAQLQRKGGTVGGTPAPAAHAKPATGLASVPEPNSTVGRSGAEIARDNKEVPLLIRKNPLEAFGLLFPYSPSDSASTGASVSFTKDQLAATRTLKLDSYVAYGFSWDLGAPRPVPGEQVQPFHVSTIMIAPFSYLTGTLAEPKKRTERSAAQFGLDGELLLSGGFQLVPVQTVRVAPYYQTDFRGTASIEGVTGQYEAYAPDLHLGTTPALGARTGIYDASGKPETGEIVSWWWRLLPEVNLIHVGDAGFTNFKPNRAYDFLGGTAQVNAVLFENYSNTPRFLCGRVHLGASYSYFWEAVEGRPYRNFEGTVAYNLSGVADKYSSSCDGETLPKGVYEGKTSLTFTYDHGTDKATLQKKNQYVVGLTYQY